MALSEIGRVARLEHAKYPDEAREFHKSIGNLERAGVDAVYAENERGGQARHVVAEVARVLGVDIDEGPGHRWDPDHMARVVMAAGQMRGARDAWKETAEDNDAANVPLRRELRTAQRQADEWRSKYEAAQANALYVREQHGHPDDVEELKNTIVRQAREITRLKGESE